MSIIFCAKKIEMGGANNTNMEANYAKILRQKTEQYIKYIESEEFAAVVAKNVFSTACKSAEIGKNAVDVNLRQILVETDPNVPEMMQVYTIESVIKILISEGLRVTYNKDNGTARLSW